MDTQPTDFSQELTEILSRLSNNQVRFVVAMLDNVSKKEAAAQVGVSQDTVYRWPTDVDRAIELFRVDAVLSAKSMLSRRLVEAVAVKLAGLESEDEKVRQSVASEVIDRMLGKPTQALEHSGEIAVKGYAVVSPDDWDND